MNLLAIRGLPFCQWVLGPNAFFTKMRLLCVQQTGLTFPLRSLSCWWSSDPATLCPSRIFLTPVSWLQNSHRQIAHLYPTEWGRRLGWAGEAFIKGMSYKLPSHVHLSTDLTLLSHQVQEHREGVGQLGNLQFCVVLELPGHGCLTQMWGGEKTVLNVTSHKLCFYRTVSAKLSLNSEHNLHWSFGFPWRPGLLLVL